MTRNCKTLHSQHNAALTACDKDVHNVTHASSLLADAARVEPTAPRKQSQWERASSRETTCRRRRTAATEAPWATRRLRENEWAERDDERARYARNQWRMALQRWLFDALVKKSLVYSWRCALFIRNDMSNEMRKRIHEQ